MIACNKHPRRFVEAHCPLQARVTGALMDAQAGGDSVFVLLVDHADVEHFGIGFIGDSLLPADLARLLAALAIRMD
jgi:hypothetical protein